MREKRSLGDSPSDWLLERRWANGRKMLGLLLIFGDTRNRATLVSLPPCMLACLTPCRDFPAKMLRVSLQAKALPSPILEPWARVVCLRLVHCSRALHAYAQLFHSDGVVAPWREKPRARAAAQRARARVGVRSGLPPLQILLGLFVGEIHPSKSVSAKGYTRWRLLAQRSGHPPIWVSIEHPELGPLCHVC